MPWHRHRGGVGRRRPAARGGGAGCPGAAAGQQKFTLLRPGSRMRLNFIRFQPFKVVQPKPNEAGYPMTSPAEKLRSHSPGHKDGGGNTSNPASQRKRPVRVLVLDDQFTGRKILEELVASVEPGVTVRSFSNPYEALEDAEQHVPDLVLTDYKMPIMDGVEFTRRFRQIGACADVPLVVVTVVSERRVRYQALEAGATDFLTRPVDHHECQARCRNL